MPKRLLANPLNGKIEDSMKVAFHIILLLLFWALIIKIVAFKVESSTPNILHGGVDVEENR